MSNKQKEVLQQHRHFLTKNIIWSGDLANKLLAHGVITDSILKDIQNISNGNHGRSKVSKLLEVLPLRGATVYEKFCNVLHIHGHSFIADFLRDEVAEKDIPNVKDIYQRVPVLGKMLKDHDKHAIEAYVIEKIRESTLKGIWSKEAIAREKDKAILAKQKQLEDAFDYEEKEKRKNEEIARLETHLSETRNDIIELKSQIGFLRSQLQQSEDKFKSDIGVQMKFSMANENALQRLQNKYDRCQETLAKIQRNLQGVLNTPVRNSEREQMALMEFEFNFVPTDFELLLEKYNLLLAIEKQYDNLLHERNYILSHLGYSPSDEDKPSLLNAYRDFAVKTDEDMTTLKDLVAQHNGVIEGQQEKIDNMSKEMEKHSHEENENRKMKTAGNVWQSAIMSVMRKQLNDVKHDNRIKETKLVHFESEITKLKAKIAELELHKGKEKLASSHHHHHNHKDKNTNEIRAASNGPSVEDESEFSSSLSKSEALKKRNTLLPPLGGRIVYKSPDNIDLPTQHSSPRKTKPKATPRHQVDTRPNVAVPEGLVTHQIRLENKGLGVVTGNGNGNVSGNGSGSGGKMGNMMSHGLGNLKAMHGKHSRQAHV